MSSPNLFYLAHPVGGDVEANIARALRWYRFLVDESDYEEVLIVMPWLPTVRAFDDSKPDDREFGMRLSIAALDTCDGIILCGGRISAGMQRELDHACQQGKRIVDLTAMGEEPPDSMFDLPDELDRVDEFGESVGDVIAWGENEWEAS